MSHAQRQLGRVAAIFVVVGVACTGPRGSSEGSESELSNGSESTGSNVVVLDEAAKERAGVEVKALEDSEVVTEVKGYGQVVDPTSLAVAAGDYAAARAAYRASSAELHRTKTLADAGNASEKSVLAAASAAARDSAQLSQTRSRLLSDWGPAIANRDDLSAFLHTLLEQELVLVRVDIPAGERLSRAPTAARLQTLSEGPPVQAELVGKVPRLDPQTQAQSLLFRVRRPGANELHPGAAVTAWVRESGEPVRGVVVPRAAILRYQGVAWVYVQTEAHQFVRRRARLDRPLEDGWLVTDGVAPGDRVVVKGAQTIFSEELNATGAVGGEED